MKVAVVWSSPNVDGLTASAKNQLIEGVKKAGERYVDALTNGFDMYY